LDLWVTPTGTARPEEVLGLLGLEDVMAGGAVLERTRMELEDEIAGTLPEGAAPSELAGAAGDRVPHLSSAPASGAAVLPTSAPGIATGPQPQGSA
jgi:hypothetical protein